MWAACGNHQLGGKREQIFSLEIIGIVEVESEFQRKRPSASYVPF
jgi:hypothetical protein